jgi:hypothetical protein
MSECHQYMLDIKTISSPEKDSPMKNILDSTATPRILMLVKPQVNSTAISTNYGEVSILMADTELDNN